MGILHEICALRRRGGSLLRKLEAGLDYLVSSSVPSSHQSRLKRILSGLRAEREEGRQLEALSQLCDLLSIGTEESLSSISVDSFVPVLVGLLNNEYKFNSLSLDHSFPTDLSKFADPSFLPGSACIFNKNPHTALLGEVGPEVLGNAGI